MEGREDPPQPERDFRQERGVGRSTERLPTADSDWDEEADPISPGWRSERARSTGRRRSAPGRMPISTADLMIWLQRGGWRWLALAGGGIVLLVVILALRSGAETTAFDVPASQDAVPAEALGLPTVTAPAVQPTTAPAPPRAFVVAGTDVEGLFLRPEPSSEGEPLKTLPEGTRLDTLGEEVQGSDRVWVKVRDPEGAEGWVARDFLAPAP